MADSMQTLENMRIAILATDGFEQAELLDPKSAVEKMGAKTAVIAPKGGSIYGMKHHDKAGSVNVDMTLDEANPADFDAVILPGGALNADALRVDEKAKAFVRAIDESGKPVAVICHGPWLLVSAGLVGDHLLTSWPTVRDDIVNAGGRWEDREVVRDKNWVSSRKPDDLPAFDRELISMLQERAG